VKFYGVEEEMTVIGEAMSRPAVGFYIAPLIITIQPEYVVVKPYNIWEIMEVKAICESEFYIIWMSVCQYVVK
jgi:hypothetical protein